MSPRGSGYLTPSGEHFSRHKKPTLNLSFSNLANTFNPQKLHSESHVLRHYKSGTSFSTEADPSGKTYEKHLYDEKEAKSRSAPTTPKGGLHMRKKPKKPKANQQELFITMHVAQILARQDFILRLARALMMYVKRGCDLFCIALY